jgi:hypothetical protein
MDLGWPNMSSRTPFPLASLALINCMAKPPSVIVNPEGFRLDHISRNMAPRPRQPGLLFEVQSMRGLKLKATRQSSRLDQ